MLKAIIHGTVHGVFFRATTKEIADRLKFIGSVRNVPNGTVEILLEGSQEDLDLLIAELKKEFSTNITNIEISEQKASLSHKGFTITH